MRSDRHRSRLGLLALAAIASIAAAAHGRPSANVPPRLSQTGLYSDIATQTVAGDHPSYSPQYPLWSDGATKRRWIHLPPGAAIDASDPDRWIFPVGTQLFKEFSLHGHRVETRMIQRNQDGTWSFATYLWDEDEQEAHLAPATGVRNAREVEPGVPWDVPGTYDCLACHGDPQTPVLGFERLQLSPDRDPRAPHGERAGELDLARLVTRGWLEGIEASDPWPRVDAATADERALRGALHANCGNCHNPHSSLADLGLFLDRARADDLRDPRILERMSTRDPSRQMPPLGTHLVDTQTVTLLQRWLAANPLSSNPR